MALVRQRRPALTLDLPVADPASDRRRLLPPLPPPPAISSSSSSATDARISDFEKLSVLGNGNGGTVYKVRHRRTLALYALKLPSASVHSASLRRELDLHLRASPHPHILPLISPIPSPSGDHAFLLELMDLGSLDSLLRRHGPLPEPALASIARRLLLGLAHLHSLQIVHRDIKPANILVNSAGEVKIADFGAGRLLRRSLDTCLSYIGTCAYMSPERFQPAAHGYDGFAGDVWSLGLTVLELRLGRFPLLGEGERADWAALVCAICLGDVTPAEMDGYDASEELKSFVGRCLERDAAKRWTVTELLSHPFVARSDSDECDRVFRELVRTES
ncbi:Mitogen-activated protein kinase kinase protein [Dioscorea alata]|uniref:Mitogen-activated protein kinase kinase protein n=1 Tax=Dioscorea alata TaxID=55571 RepID=A0ACB7U8S0_DIOAL|nr:Mitogen-activated protein kinase kinase protein [Dioscorea alata]